MKSNESQSAFAQKLRRDKLVRVLCCVLGGAVLVAALLFNLPAFGQAGGGVSSGPTQSTVGTNGGVTAQEVGTQIGPSGSNVVTNPFYFNAQGVGGDGHSFFQLIRDNTNSYGYQTWSTKNLASVWGGPGLYVAMAMDNGAGSPRGYDNGMAAGDFFSIGFVGGTTWSEFDLFKEGIEPWNIGQFALGGGGGFSGHNLYGYSTNSETESATLTITDLSAAQVTNVPLLTLALYPNKDGMMVFNAVDSDMYCLTRNDTAKSSWIRFGTANTGIFRLGMYGPSISHLMLFDAIGSGIWDDATHPGYPLVDILPTSTSDYVGRWTFTNMDVQIRNGGVGTGINAPGGNLYVSPAVYLGYAMTNTGFFIATNNVNVFSVNTNGAVKATSVTSTSVVATNFGIASVSGAPTITITPYGGASAWVVTNWANVTNGSTFATIAIVPAATMSVTNLFTVTIDHSATVGLFVLWSQASIKTNNISGVTQPQVFEDVSQRTLNSATWVSGTVGLSANKTNCYNIIFFVN